jgi:magnesium transporter
LKVLTCSDKENQLKVEQASLIVRPTFVVSLQESEGDVFDPIRERLRKAKGRIRKMGSDYLAYALVDAIVDNYFVILEKIGEKILSDPFPFLGIGRILSMLRQALVDKGFLGCRC